MSNRKYIKNCIKLTATHIQDTLPLEAINKYWKVYTIQYTLYLVHTYHAAGITVFLLSVPYYSIMVYGTDCGTGTPGTMVFFIIFFQKKNSNLDGWVWVSRFLGF